jgi:hypothetical protein
MLKEFAYVGAKSRRNTGNRSKSPISSSNHRNGYPLNLSGWQYTSPAYTDVLGPSSHPLSAVNVLTELRQLQNSMDAFIEVGATRDRIETPLPAPAVTAVHPPPVDQQTTSLIPDSNRALDSIRDIVSGSKRVTVSLPADHGPEPIIAESDVQLPYLAPLQPRQSPPDTTPQPTVAIPSPSVSDIDGALAASLKSMRDAIDRIHVPTDLDSSFFGESEDGRRDSAKPRQPQVRSSGRPPLKGKPSPSSTASTNVKRSVSPRLRGSVSNHSISLKPGQASPAIAPQPPQPVNEAPSSITPWQNSDADWTQTLLENASQRMDVRTQDISAQVLQKVTSSPQRNPLHTQQPNVTEYDVVARAREVFASLTDPSSFSTNNKSTISGTAPAIVHEVMSAEKSVQIGSDDAALKRLERAGYSMHRPATVASTVNIQLETRTPPAVSAIAPPVASLTASAVDIVKHIMAQTTRQPAPPSPELQSFTSMTPPLPQSSAHSPAPVAAPGDDTDDSFDWMSMSRLRELERIVEEQVSIRIAVIVHPVVAW